MSMALYMSDSKEIYLNFTICLPKNAVFFSKESIILASSASMAHWFSIIFHQRISCSCFFSSLVPWTPMDFPFCHVSPFRDVFCFLCGVSPTIEVSDDISPCLHSDPSLHPHASKEDSPHSQMHSGVDWVDCCKVSYWSEFQSSFRNCVSLIKPYVASLFVLNSDAHHMDLSDF